MFVVTLTVLVCFLNESQTIPGFVEEAVRVAEAAFKAAEDYLELAKNVCRSELKSIQHRTLWKCIVRHG